MLDRSLYWLVTRSLGVKAGILVLCAVVLFWIGSAIASIPAAQAAASAAALQTVTAKQELTTTAVGAATAQAVAHVTAVAQGYTDATATTIAEATGIVLEREAATSTAVAAITGAAQAKLDASSTAVAIAQGATETAVAGATAQAQSAIQTTVAGATAKAQARQEATHAAVVNVTVTALAKAVNATATARARAASAEATAVWRTFASYQSTAPKGDFSATGRTAAIACNVQYSRCTSDYSCAGSNSKYIVLNIAVQNVGRGDVYVNPIDFTLVSTDDRAVSLDDGTFALNGYLDGISIDSGTHTQGRIAFLVLKTFIPGRLVWRSFDETVQVPIVQAPDQ